MAGSELGQAGVAAVARFAQAEPDLARGLEALRDRVRAAPAIAARHVTTEQGDRD